MKKAILFDFDGTLFFCTEELNIYSMNKALADMGKAPMTHEQLLATIGATPDEIAQILLGADYALCKEELLGRLYQYVPEAIEAVAVMDEETRVMLRRLSEATKIAVCSNAHPDYLLTLLDRFDIRKYFSCIWYHRDGYAKVNAIPEIVAELGVKQAIMVGDRIEDVEAGKANGCTTVAIRSGIGPQDAQGADYTVHSHGEMLDLLLRII